MCGFICTNDRNFEFQEALNRATYRGPDFQGVYECDGIRFGHNRLAILDLDERSNQPMIKGGYVIVFNGEIYNYRELKKSHLMDFGDGFATSGDTEVVLSMYIAYGAEMLNHINGMFAFTIYDPFKKELFCAVDRLGVKPLYYRLSRGGIVLGSECWKMSSRLSKDGVSGFLTYGYVAPPKTIFEDVFKFEPGTCMTYRIEENTVTTNKYWDANSFTEEKKLNSAKFKNLIKDSVRLRLESDVPVCCFLSGGVDSSLLASILKKEINVELTYYTIGVRDNTLDEAEKAKEIASALGLNHEVIYFENEDVLKSFDECIRVLDEPLGDSSLLPTNMVCGVASNKFKVALSADGGDELSMGYPKYMGVKRALKRRQRLRFLKLVPTALLYFVIGKIFKSRFRADLYLETIIADNISSEEDMLRHVSRKISINKEKRILNHSPTSYRSGNCTQSQSDLLNYLPGDILRKIDKASMAVSLEAREPFLDYRLFEMFLCLETNEKADKEKLKKPLRQLLAEYLDPAIWDLPKKGFSVPINDWLRDELKERLEKSIECCISLGAVKSDGIHECYADFVAGDDSDGDFLWNLLILGEFVTQNNLHS